jgi:hypothetical protein
LRGGANLHYGLKNRIAKRVAEIYEGKKRGTKKGDVVENYHFSRI